MLAPKFKIGDKVTINNILENKEDIGTIVDVKIKPGGVFSYKVDFKIGDRAYHTYTFDLHYLKKVEDNG